MTQPFKYTDKRKTASTDTECYQNYWSIGFRCVETGKQKILELYEGHPLNRTAIATIFHNWRLVTFNGINYDMPMITLAMSGADNKTLKRASDDIILGDLRSWQFYERYGLQPPENIDLIDWMEVSPGSPQKPSLKQYAGRLHSRTMRDLPFEPDAWITPEDRPVMREYLGNDLVVTGEGFLELKTQIELRALMSEQYGVDLRSKSDAQMSEAIMRAEFERDKGQGKRKRIYPPDIKPGTFFFKPAPWIKFQTPQLQQLLKDVINNPYIVRSDGEVVDPPILQNRTLDIGGMVFKFGLGGLHSQESAATHVSDNVFTLRDRDVKSYYPSLIIASGVSPKHLGPEFQAVYRKLYNERLAAKKGKSLTEKDKAETLKIALNGVFGKTNSHFSILYSPELMVQTTITGQLALLMLIETVVLAGMQIVSANTDGVVTKVPNDRTGDFNAIIFDWECETGLETEETVYSGLYSRDVNCYFAICMPDKDGKVEVKRKGNAFVPRGRGHKGAAGLKYNPVAAICAEAVIALMKSKVPVEDTIRECEDIRQFVSVRKVNGGAEKDGEYLGKVVRWYQATNVSGTIVYASNQNTVPKTEGAKPCMTLPDEFPDDIDYDWYIREAYALLEDVGAAKIDPAFIGRSGTTLARLEEQKTLHTVDLSTGVACCGKTRGSIRDRWIEYKSAPEGFRVCGPCKKAEL